MLSIEKQMLFLLTRTDQMSAKDLIQIYTKRGYKEQSIRNVLSRLKKESLIAAAARSTYTITKKGADMLASVNRKPWQYNLKWDRTWCMVHFEVPEAERAKRDQFRTSLLQMGFGPLYKGVYLSPWDSRHELVALIETSGLEPYVTLTESTMVYNDISKDRAAAIWPLREIHSLYTEKQKWYEESFRPALQNQLQGDMDPLELFALYLHIGEEISHLSLQDPMLPLELLPDNWIGHQVLQEFYRAFQSFATIIPRESPYYAFLV